MCDPSEGRRSPQNATRRSPWNHRVEVRLQYSEPGGILALTYPPIFYLQISAFGEPTSGLEPLTSPHYELAVIGSA